MDEPKLTMAQQIAEAARAFQLRRTPPSASIASL